MAKKEDSTKKGGSVVKNVKENFILYAAIAVVVVIGIAIAINSVGLDTLASFLGAEAHGGCPSYKDVLAQKKVYLTSDIVGASFTIDAATKTVNYYFDSLENRNSTKGKPGLRQYCIYPSTSVSLISNITSVAVGNKDKDFRSVAKNKDYNYIGFGRDGGDDHNIPLDGTTGILMGNAVWSGEIPSTQTILLHIYDKVECKALYGHGDDCFVYPTIAQKPQFGNIIVTKYNDLNKNGVQDSGEGALAGWDITLYGSTGAQVSQGTTDANGQVNFASLAAGNYVVKETLMPLTTHWANTDPGGSDNTFGLCPSSKCCVQDTCPTPSKPATVIVGGNTQVAFGNVLLVAS